MEEEVIAEAVPKKGESVRRGRFLGSFRISVNTSAIERCVGSADMPCPDTNG
jgi:hypothetical protein